jgi:hypothetical protein
MSAGRMMSNTFWDGADVTPVNLGGARLQPA